MSAMTFRSVKELKELMKSREVEQEIKVNELEPDQDEGKLLMLRK